MEIYIGTVVQNEDLSKSGELLVTFPKIYQNQPQLVTYTSPYCKANAGGFIAVPNVGDDILAFHDPDAGSKGSAFYYLSTVLKSDLDIGDKDTVENPNFELLKSNDPKAQIYGKRNRPVTQTFTNDAGAGLYIQREFNEDSISNNVTMKSEGGEEVNVSPLGVQIRNADGDSIVLNGAEPNAAYGARTLAIETQAAQEYKCINSDISMRILDGGDINIENNSVGFHAIPPFFGNIRLKSRYRGITLAALGPPPFVSDIHIVTNTGKLHINGATGQMTIYSPTTIDINSLGSINLNAGVDLNLKAGGTATMNSAGITTVKGGGAVNIQSAGLVSQNGSTLSFNDIPLATINPPQTWGSNGGASVPVVSSPVPQSPLDVPTPTPPLPNEYGDGVPGAEGGNAI
tara:strand:- start:20526 stop:21728 length:1203 start_codon:yes stop_codon:yes gene_type:complete